MPSGHGNLLTNSDFQDWTVANTPDNWTIVVGSAGTNIFDSTGTFYTGSHSLQITGDGGGTNTQIRQLFNDSTGTLGALTAETVYAVNLWIRRDGTPAAAGVLTVDLYDGSAVVNGEGSYVNSFTIDLTALTTSFVAYSGIFLTPIILPSTAYIRLRLSTPLTNSRSVYIGQLSMGVMTQSYLSGPYFSIHAGATNFEVGDYLTATITNSRGAAGTLITWQTLWQQWFYSYMMPNELLLPYAGSPTELDSWIT